MSDAYNGGRYRRKVGRNRSPVQDVSTIPASRQLDRFERLLDAGVAILSAHELGKVLQLVTDAARDIVGARYAALGVLNEDGTALAQFVTSGLPDAQRAQIPALPQGLGLLQAVLRERRPIRTADIARHPARHGFPPFHPAMKSFLGVPILNRDQVFGNLYLTDKSGADEFDTDDERIAVFLARKAAVAVENVRLLDQLRAFQTSRDQFHAMMNHELRNALTGVYGWLDLLISRGEKPAPRAAVAAFTAAEHSVQLLNDLLDLSRLDSGRFEVKPKHTSGEAILIEALRAVEPTAEAAGVHLEPGQLEPTTSARTDPTRVRQILVNLLRNAIEYSPAQTAVGIVMAADADVLSFSVIDRGPGIDERQQQQLFEAYSRLDQDRAGTGLGLTLSRRLARLLGGDIQILSKLGQGSTFTLSIPRFLGTADASPDSGA